MSEGRSSLVLASTSPQRRSILEQLRIPFEAVTPDFAEEARNDGDAVEMVEQHAIGKARAVSPTDGRFVLGVDTTVVLEGRIFGKPADEDEAREMLAALAGKTHEVVSGLGLIGDGWTVVDHDVTAVSFRALSQSEIDAHTELGEWRGRAGGYAIQGAGASLVTAVKGDYLNVVGLPAALLVRVLSERAPGRFGFGS